MNTTSKERKRKLLSIKAELERIKEFIETKIKEKNFMMCREPVEGEDASNLELVHPRVKIGNLPHSNFSLYGADERFFQAPYFLVGFETSSHDYTEEFITILIQVCAYPSETYEHEEGELAFPDISGMLDVVTALETVRDWIIEDAKFPANRPFQIGSYASKELTYPYAFGYLSFELETKVGVKHQPKFF